MENMGFTNLGLECRVVIARFCTRMHPSSGRDNIATCMYGRREDEIKMKSSGNTSSLIRPDMRMHPICLTLGLIPVPEHVRIIVRKLIPVWAHCILRWARVSTVTFIIDHNVHIIVIEIVESRALLLVTGKSRGRRVGVRIL